MKTIVIVTRADASTVASQLRHLTPTGSALPSIQLASGLTECRRTSSAGYALPSDVIRRPDPRQGNGFRRAPKVAPRAGAFGGRRNG